MTTVHEAAQQVADLIKNLQGEVPGFWVGPEGGETTYYGCDADQFAGYLGGNGDEVHPFKSTEEKK